MRPFIDKCAPSSPDWIGHPLDHVVWATDLFDPSESNQAFVRQSLASNHLADDFPGALRFRDETTAKPNRMTQARSGHRVNHGLSVCDRRCERFLAEQMLTRLNGT